MTGIELFAYVILPLSIGAGVWGGIFVSEWLGRRHRQAGE
jgi:hypothetical protein